MKKTNNKGFTLVELIVVLVILAILAAILVPALLGYIDKAREKQVTTNAEAAYVAAQALATEAYGKGVDPSDVEAYCSAAKIKDLTDISEGFSVSITFNGKGGTQNSNTRKSYIISEFTYTQNAANGKKATWYQEGTTKGSEVVPAGGWYVENKE